MKPQMENVHPAGVISNWYWSDMAPVLFRNIPVFEDSSIEMMELRVHIELFNVNSIYIYLNLHNLGMKAELTPM